MTVSTRLHRLLTNRFDIPAEELRPAVTFDALKFDSLDLVDLALAAEEEFGVSISDDEAEDLRTVDDAAALIEAKIARLAGA